MTQKIEGGKKRTPKQQLDRMNKIQKEAYLEGMRMTKEMLKADDLTERFDKEFPVRHYYCDDPWYTCPMNPEGCANEADGNECNCGAIEEHQKRKDFISDLLASERQRCVEEILGGLLMELKEAKKDGKYYEKEYGGDKNDPRIRVNYMIHRVEEAIDQAKHNLEQSK
jgi:hypothetical protein